MGMSKDDAGSVLDVHEYALALGVGSVTAGSNEENTEEGEEAAADKGCGLGGGGALKVAVEHGAAQNGAEREHDKLNGNDDGRVGALKGAVDVADLEDGGD